MAYKTSGRGVGVPKFFGTKQEPRNVWHFTPLVPLIYNIGSQATLIFKTCGRKVTPEWSEKSFKNGKFWVPLFSLMTGYLLGSGKKWNDLSLLPSSSSHCWSWKIDETLLLLAEHRRQGLSWWWLWGAGMASHPHFLWDTRKCSRKSSGAVASMHVVY